MIFKLKEKVKAKVVEIEVDRIKPNPYQPRKTFSDEEIYNLAQSIKVNGVLQPITVKRTDEGYELIAGERRVRACRLIKLPVIPAIIIEATGQESAVLAVIENIQRSDLNYFEEALAMQRLINYYDLTQEQLAARLGKSQSTVANKLRLLRLPNALQKRVIEYGFNERQVRALLKLPDELSRNAVEYIHDKKLNVSQTEEYINQLLCPVHKKKKREWVFKVKQLYINSINKTLDTMKKSGIEFDATKRIDNGYLEYVIRIPHD